MVNTKGALYVPQNFYEHWKGVMDREEREIYMYLQSYCYDGKTTCFPSENTIAEDLGLSPRTIVRRIQSLQKKKIIFIISRSSRGKAKLNTYRLTSWEKIKKMHNSLVSESQIVPPSQSIVPPSQSIVPPSPKHSDWVADESKQGIKTKNQNNTTKPPAPSSFIVSSEADETSDSLKQGDDMKAMRKMDQMLQELKASPTESQIIRWFHAHYPNVSIRNYFLKFINAHISEDMLNQFVELMEDYWDEYPAIQKTDKSIMMFISNVEKFVETYWELHVRVMERQRQLDESNARHYALVEYLDDHNMWRNITDDNGSPIDPEYLVVRRIIRDYFRNDTLDNRTDFWAFDPINFELKDDKLYCYGREMNPDDFTKENIIRKIEMVEEKLHSPKPEPIMDEATQSAIFAAIMAPEEPERIPPWEMERFERELLSSLDKE
jgi:DNA-binding Lrp family transcriptional regulator